MLDNIKEQFTHRLEQKHTHVAIQVTKAFLRVDVYLQVILLFHLRGQPGDGLRQPFSLQDDRAEINAQIAGDGNGIREPALQLIKMRLHAGGYPIFIVLSSQQNQLRLNGEESLLQVVVQDLRDAMTLLLLWP